MRIDRSDPAEGPGDAEGSLSLDDVAASSEHTDRGTAVRGDGPPDSSYSWLDSASRVEEAAFYQAKVKAVNRQYAIDHSHVGVEKLEYQTDTTTVLRIEAANPKPHATGTDDRPRGGGGQSEAIEENESQTRYTPTRTRVTVDDSDLREGYAPSPALKGDPYHPDKVAARSTANHELYGASSRDQAAALGYNTRIAAQKAPFDSHGQEVFTNGKSYITPDVDGHNVTNGWKMFSKRGARIGTYDSELNYVKE